MTTSQLVANFSRVIINPLIELIFAVGLLVFIWGLIEFLIGLNLEEDHAKQEAGKRHMFYGIAGMFVMVASYAILNFIASNICGSLSGCYQGFL